MVKSALVISCLVMLASAKIATPHELLQNTFVYDPENSFTNAFLRSFFGWQAVGAFNECLSVFLPWTGSLALLWVLLALSYVGDSENYTNPFDLIYDEFMDALLLTYNQQRCYFFTTVSELTLSASVLSGNLGYLSSTNNVVVQVVTYVISFYGIQLVFMNILSFFMDFWALLTNNQPYARLGYMTGDFLKFFMGWYPILY